MGGAEAQFRVQGWDSPWADDSNPLIGTMDGNGNYEVRGLPALQATDGLRFGGNLEATGAVTVGAGWSYDRGPSRLGYYNLSPPPHQPRDLMITHEEGGQTQRWIAYTADARQGVTAQEGETVQRDVHLEPTALIRGHVVRNSARDTPVPGGAGPLVGRGTIADAPTVTYVNRHSIFGEWAVSCDKNGDFELPVPVGTVALLARDGDREDLRIVTGLQPHEVRLVEFQPQLIAPELSHGTPPLMMRVLGPDGATVPRARIDCTGEDGRSKLEQDSRDYVGMDGSFTIHTAASDPSLRITSPYLDKPVQIDLDDGQLSHTIRLDRLPVEVGPQRGHGDAYLRELQGLQPGDPDQSQSTHPPATPAAIGQPAPELEVYHWLVGGPLKLADLRGKVVVLWFQVITKLGTGHR